MGIKLFLSTLLFMISCLSEGQVALSWRQITLLDSIATQDVPQFAPGIASAIIRDGKVIYEKYAGYADLTDSIFINKTTRFNIASNGKQFTALAVLTLVDAGKLRLSDDIRKFFPSLFPKIKEKISVQSLLNHTSGIRDCYDLWSLQGYTWWEKTFSNNDVLELIKKQEDLNFRPDTKYLYSNTNYILLALIIGKVSGKGFVEYTNEMFKKLSMPNTSFEDDYTRIRGQIARAYFNFGTWTTYNWIWNACGDGNIFSTLEDQVQWEKIVQGTVKTGIHRDIIIKSQQPIKGSTSRNYGYGLEFSQYKGLDYSFHEGATGAWKANIIRFPEKKSAFLTLTNTGKSIPSMQTRQMADIVFGLKPDADYIITRPDTIGKFVSDDEIIGTYLTEDNYAFQFEKTDNKIFLKRTGRNDVELEREANNIFHQKYDTAFRQEFTTNANGVFQVTVYYINHAPYSLIKQSADFSGFDFNGLAGRFVNTETGTSIDISYKSGKSYNVKIAGNDTTIGLLITPDKFLVDNYDMDFQANSPKIQVFYLNSDRMKGVRFVRQKL